MSGNRDSEQPQKYCGTCGAQVRPGTAFCVSCGARLGAESQASEHTNPDPTPSRPASLASEGSFETATRRVKALPKPSGIVVVMVTLGLLMAVLVTLFPLVSPLLEYASQAILLVPLLVFAISVFGLLLESDRVERRRLLKGLGLIALVTYFFFSAYHVVLESLGFIEGGGISWLLVLVLVCGLVYVVFALRNRGENATPARSAFVADWRVTLRNVFQWMKFLPLPVKVAVVMGILGLLSLLSPYIFVLGAALVGASVLALIVRAVQRMPLKQAGGIALASLALTVAFGSVSDALYNTGTGLELSVSPSTSDESGPDGTRSDAAARRAPGSTSWWLASPTTQAARRAHRPAQP